MISVSASTSVSVNTPVSKTSTAPAEPAPSGADPGGAPARMRTAIATVCISGTLEDKLVAAAAAGFDGVEIFEPDFVVSPLSAAEVKARCDDLGLSIDLYQPFRDFDSVRPEAVEANLRRADRKFDVMEQMGTNQVLVCSANYPDAVDDDGQIAEQLHRLASRAAERGMLISYEALAWSTYVNTYERAWDIVRTADHPALGMCIDSFHILSRGSDPAGIENIPADKLFFLQLADAPSMDMDLLQWSRHYRLFPGQGAFDLPAFLGHVLTAGYTGPAVARGVQRRLPAVGPQAGRGRRAPVTAGVARIHPRPAVQRDPRTGTGGGRPTGTDAGRVRLRRTGGRRGQQPRR